MSKTEVDGLKKKKRRRHLVSNYNRNLTNHSEILSHRRTNSKF